MKYRDGTPARVGDYVKGPVQARDGATREVVALLTYLGPDGGCAVAFAELKDVSETNAHESWKDVGEVAALSGGFGNTSDLMKV